MASYIIPISFTENTSCCCPQGNKALKARMESAGVKVSKVICSPGEDAGAVVFEAGNARAVQGAMKALAGIGQVHGNVPRQIFAADFSMVA